MWLSIVFISISLVSLCCAAALARQQSRVALAKVGRRHGC